MVTTSRGTFHGLVKTRTPRTQGADGTLRRPSCRCGSHCRTRSRGCSRRRVHAESRWMPRANSSIASCFSHVSTPYQTAVNAAQLQASLWNAACRLTGMSRHTHSDLSATLADVAKAVGRLHKMCCRDDRSPRLGAMEEQIDDVTSQRSGPLENAPIDEVIERLETTAGEIGQRRVACCAPARMPAVRRRRAGLQHDSGTQPIAGGPLTPSGRGRRFDGESEHRGIVEMTVTCQH